MEHKEIIKKIKEASKKEDLQQAIEAWVKSHPPSITVTWTDVFYAMDLPELGVSAVIRCDHDPNTNQSFCEVANIIFKDGSREWDQELEELVLDIFSKSH